MNLLKLILPAVLASTAFLALAGDTRRLLEPKDGAERSRPSSAQVTVRRSEGTQGVVVTIAPGNEGYPGVAVKPEGKVWDLSAFGHVSARVANLGTKPLHLALRVDNAGTQGESWNTESVTLQPGETGTVTTIFGYSYGKKPGYALQPSAVTQLLLFALKSDAEQSFRIDSLEAGGSAGERPPVAPEDVRIKPDNGALLGGVKIDPAAQIATKNAQAVLKAGGALSVMFPAAKGGQSVQIKPPRGRWDLRDQLQVRIALRNDGAASVAPRARVESNGGPSDWIAAVPLAVGASTEIVMPFAGSTPLTLNKKDQGNRITSDAVSAITISVDGAEAGRTLSIESIKADLPVQTLPEWLGKHPPVEGEWVQTLDDEFNGDMLDTSIWQISGPNYWDKQTHWSKDNVLFGGGVVKLRYEKKTGFHDDNPKNKQTNWQSGYLHTFDKWAQRYGYFEARMKLPKAPGLWPAFWTMPDRGRGVANRQDTANGGMEFDIMEFLTRWGPNRYNVAMHYDGYGKEHKGLGSDRLYVQPDKDGFITSGLLWTPGVAAYYGNGKEICRWEDPRISDVPQILMFTLPMGGWDNSPLDEKQLPDDFIIDYVRVWQRKDLARDGDGRKAAPDAK